MKPTRLGAVLSRWCSSCGGRGTGRAARAGRHAHGGRGDVRQRALAAAPLRRRRGHRAQAAVGEPPVAGRQGQPHPDAGREVARSMDGGKTWKFQLKKGVRFHNGAELTAEDVKFTFTTLAREGSANSMAPEFRTIKSMEVEGPHAISIRFDKPFVTFGNRVTQGLFASWPTSSRRSTSRPGSRPPSVSPSAPGPGSSWSTCAVTGSCSRRSRATGARRPTSSASCSSRCPSRPRAWPCCAPATPTSSRSAASTWTS